MPDKCPSPGVDDAAMAYLLYIASALGAVAVYLMMPRRGYTPRRLGALLGAVTLGAVWLYLAEGYLPVAAARGIAAPAMAYYYLFSLLAIVSAVRVITHPGPVYAALWFVMVVLSSAGLFVILSAEFMAFAMVIVYGGAILVTYVFVIMLASRPDDPSKGDAAPDYDREAREPAAAVAVGFVLLAALLSTVFAPASPHVAALAPRVPAAIDEALIASQLSRRPAAAVLDRLAEPDRRALAATLLSDDRLDNAERVGLDLFRAHPLGLELAGVILALALIGAVVFARTRVDAEPEPGRGNS